MVARIQKHDKFARAVSEAEQVLRDRGSVLVGCKSGIHRAPTVAAEVGRRSINAYTVHCSLNNFTKTDMMLLLGSCLYCPRANDVRREKSATQLCLAWPWMGTAECPEDMIPSQESLGSVEEHPEIDECLNICPRGSNRIRMVPSTWVLPLRLIETAMFNCNSR